MNGMNAILLGIIGGSEILLILVAVLVLFGGKKIPELMKGLGQGIKEFKNATNNTEMGEELKNIKKEINSVSDDIKKSANL